MRATNILVIVARFACVLSARIWFCPSESLLDSDAKTTYLDSTWHQTCNNWLFFDISDASNPDNFNDWLVGNLMARTPVSDPEIKMLAHFFRHSSG